MKKITTLIVCMVLLGAVVMARGTGPEPFEPRAYDNAKVMRVKHVQGEAYVRRSYDEGFEEAAENLPVFEKDVAGTTDGRLEVYLGKLNYLRLDYDSEVVFDRAPELRKTALGLRIVRGGVYLDIANLDYERDIEIQTPDCGVFLLDKGVYRINVNDGGLTELYVYEGMAEVAGDHYNRNVRENQKVVMLGGDVRERPFYFYSSESDGFDKWNSGRGDAMGYARHGSSRYLDDGYEEYEYELSRNGRWRYEATYGSYVWIPYNVGTDWRPYYHGRWVWNPSYGYTWMSFDSWGYFTHHYGRWHWDPVYRWCWVPGYRWSPAWVSWFWDDNYYGWCPLSRWNRPVVVYGGHWWRHHDHRRHGIPYHARSTTIIKKNKLSASGIHRVALRTHDNGNLNRITKKSLKKSITQRSIAFRGNAPRIRPENRRVNVINARGKSVVYKRNGIVSSGKYRETRAPAGVTKSRAIGKRDGVVFKYSGKKLSRDRVNKYGKSPYVGKSGSTVTRSKAFKSRTVKSKTYQAPRPYRYGSGAVKKNRGDSGERKKTYRSGGRRSTDSGVVKRSPRGSGDRGKPVYRSKPRKTESRKVESPKSRRSPGKSSSPKKVKKKKDSTSYAFGSSDTSSGASSGTSSYGYGSHTPRSSRDNRKYASPRRTGSSSGYRSSASRRAPPRSSTSSSSYRSSNSRRSPSKSTSYRSSNSRRSPSKSTSYRSSGSRRSSSRSTSYRSSGSRSSGSSRGSRGSSSVRRSSSGSSSGSSSRRSSSSSSGRSISRSSSSSSGSVKKKN